jgi:hypothetical protein
MGKLTRCVSRVVPDTHRFTPLAFAPIRVARLPRLLHREGAFGPFPFERDNLGGESNGKRIRVGLVDGASDGCSTADGLL